MSGVEWKVVCDRCGCDYLNHQLRREWNGLRTCYAPGTNKCWEKRHPQDNIRAKPDNQALPWSRPPGEADENNTTTQDDL